VALGRARLGLGLPAEALKPFAEADRFWREFDAGNRGAGEAAFWLARCYEGLGREAEAVAPRTRARAILGRSALPGDSKLLRLARGR
jgi:hypothetical protein